MLSCASVAEAATSAGENTPLHLSSGSGAGSVVHAAAGGGGGSSILRTIIALVVVVGIIYAIARILKAVKGRDVVRASGNGLEQIATLPLAPGRSVSLVRSGRDIVLLGVGESGVSTIKTYTEQEAIAAGLEIPTRRRVGRLRADRAPDGSGPGRPTASDGPLVKIDSSNALQILVLIGGLSLVPAILFTVTGFTRILIVLGFIRSAMGTTTTPPNQVLIGISLFLTLFVMAPTITAIKKDAWEPLQHHQITMSHSDHPRRGAAARVHVPPGAERGHSPCSCHWRTSRRRRRGPRCRPTSSSRPSSCPSSRRRFRSAS